jgi:uncharacterized RDD family membrane protein YckC
MDPTTVMRPAGFWRRALAALLDLLVFFLVQVSFGFVAARVAGADVEEGAGFLPLVWSFTLVFTTVYTTVLHAWLGGQTIGKALVGIRVVTIDGGPLPVGTALLRHLGYFASIATLTLGYLMAGLRRDKRALHDLLAGTRVEHTSTAVERPEPETETVGGAAGPQGGSSWESARVE